MQNDLLIESASAAQNAKALYLVKSDALENCPAPERLKALAGANGFSGEAGAFVVGEDGVLYGVGDGADALVLAGAADKLPAGDYRLAESLDDQAAELAVYAWLIGGYRFDRYKKVKAAEARLVVPDNADVAAARCAASGAAFVRDLVNTPAGDLTPAALADEAKKLAGRYDATIDIIEGDALLDQNFPMIHAVGRAADVAPRLIDIRWGRNDAPKVTLVGKGVCFDSGGLNIKAGAGMALMKKDMGGSAHALGLGQMIMEAGLDVRLRILAPAVENAISGNAFRPGDILSSRRGLSVEIGNTDAEGRLILGDALALASEEDPELVVSLATLTGAARIALGPEVVPFYCDDEKLCSDLASASLKEADPVWRLPLWAGYDSMLSSSIADLNHISGNSFAGSVIAALFLKRFVKPESTWLHFDLYAWRAKAAPGRPVGAETQAIRALFRVLADRYGA